MIRNADIVCFSSIDWDFIWQGHQQIMSTLAAAGNRVLFVENTGVRAAALKDLPRLKSRLRNWWKGTKGFRQVQDNLFVYSPVLLPFPYSRLVRWINRHLLFSALQRWMHAIGFRRPLVWTFLPTPLVLDMIRRLDPELTVYYCIDDLASSSPQARRIRTSERQLFRQADLVFVTSEKLRERAERDAPRVHVFPFGVDFDKFAGVRAQADGVPADLRSLPRPIIGYVGGLHQWLDQDLVAAAAARMPEASFVLVGPTQTDVSRLARHANVHLLDARPHDQVPRYIKGFDVGVIAYRLSDYTAHVYPTKMNEYLAMGIPVVATDLSEVRRFNAQFGDIVRITHSQEEFVGALRAATQPPGAGDVARRIEVARRNSWDARIEQMAELIQQRLQARQLEGQRWQARLRRLYRTANRRLLKIAVLLLAGYGMLSHTGVVWQVAEPLRVAEPPRPADAIVVFAGGVGESGKAGEGYQERVKQAVDLHQAGFAPRIVFASGYTFLFPEAELMKSLAVDQGVPASAIQLETHAANTRELAASAADLARREGWHTVLLVSSPYHMRRALLTWRKAAPELTVVPTPVPESRFYARGRRVTAQQIRGIVHEYAAILAYRLQGWL
jgi:uncharacterized SAM-binding protein YcdF (DUF218 family)/glycosyltransferase involved in cell wall biosynthesis